MCAITLCSVWPTISGSVRNARRADQRRPADDSAQPASIGCGPPLARRRARPAGGSACALGRLGRRDSPGSFAPGHGLATRLASTKPLRSGWPSNSGGSSSGRAGPGKPMPNISYVSRSCQAAPGIDVDDRRPSAARSAAPGCAAARRAGRCVDQTCATTSKPVVQLVDGGQPVEEVAAQLVAGGGQRGRTHGCGRHVDDRRAYGRRRHARRAPATLGQARSDSSASCRHPMPMSVWWHRDQRYRAGRSAHPLATPAAPRPLRQPAWSPATSGVIRIDYLEGPRTAGPARQAGERGRCGTGRRRAGGPARAWAPYAWAKSTRLRDEAGLVACRPRRRSPPRWRSRPGRGWTRRRRPSASGPPPGPGRATTPASSSGSLTSDQSRSAAYGRDLGDELADAVQLGVAQPRVGVRLQRPLRLGGAVALVLEVAAHPLVVDVAGPPPAPAPASCR